jgi:hypothetical protein
LNGNNGRCSNCTGHLIFQRSGFPAESRRPSSSGHRIFPDAARAKPSSLKAKRCSRCWKKFQAPREMQIRKNEGAEGDYDLLKLRPDFVLHARHGADGRGLKFMLP